MVPDQFAVLIDGRLYGPFADEDTAKAWGQTKAHALSEESRDATVEWEVWPLRQPRPRPAA